MNTTEETIYCRNCKRNRLVERIPLTVSDHHIGLYCSVCGAGPLRTVREEVDRMTTPKEPREPFVYEILQKVKPELIMQHLCIYEINGKMVVIDSEQWSYLETREDLQSAVNFSLSVLLGG